MSKQGHTILVVDDAPANIRLITSYLKNQYRVLAATSGESALQIIKKQNTDLVLLDINMPGMNGFETCERIKSTPESQSLPVILISSSVDEDSVKKSSTVGASYCLQKPLVGEDLLTNIENLLSNK
ncbi:response regulator receiver [Vibrio ishigakensis]|uniref:Response regulator receiver n=1 Tax=Vibrio ishigakensis TaxID=1481914 RepID=A0A0B8QL37_9VIBR|nr:response regulator receiver [Vibrio ishigakensis]